MKFKNKCLLLSAIALTSIAATTAPFLVSCSNNTQQQTETKPTDDIPNININKNVEYSPSSKIANKISEDDLKYIWSGVYNNDRNACEIATNSNPSIDLNPLTLKVNVSLIGEVLIITNQLTFLSDFTYKDQNNNVIYVKKDDVGKDQFCYYLTASAQQTNNNQKFKYVRYLNNEVTATSYDHIGNNNDLLLEWNMGRFYEGVIQVPDVSAPVSVKVSTDYYKLSTNSKKAQLYDIIQLNQVASPALEINKSLVYKEQTYVYDGAFNDMYWTQEIIDQVESIHFPDNTTNVDLNKTWTNLAYIQVPTNANVNTYNNVVIKQQKLDNNYICYYFK